MNKQSMPTARVSSSNPLRHAPDHSLPELHADVTAARIDVPVFTLAS
jgi:hypothetical protein